MSSVEYPQNEFTRMIERVSQTNAAGGYRGAPVHTGERPPSVQSAAMREPLPDEEPLSMEEKARLDQLAIAAGIVDPRLGNVASGGENYSGGTSQEQYANMTMEEVLAAGASVRQPVVDVPSAGSDLVPARRDRPGAVNVRPQPPTTIAPSPPPTPRLPNFRNVQGIDLTTGEVFVDGMSFKIDSDDLASFRRYAVEVARTNIMQQLEEAMDMFSQDEEPVEDQDGGNDTESEGSDAALQSDSEGDCT